MRAALDSLHRPAESVDNPAEPFVLGAEPLNLLIELGNLLIGFFLNLHQKLGDILIHNLVSVMFLLYLLNLTRPAVGDPRDGIAYASRWDSPHKILEYGVCHRACRLLVNAYLLEPGLHIKTRAVLCGNLVVTYYPHVRMAAVELQDIIHECRLLRVGTCI